MVVIPVCSSRCSCWVAPPRGLSHGHGVGPREMALAHPIIGIGLSGSVARRGMVRSFTVTSQHIRVATPTNSHLEPH